MKLRRLLLEIAHPLTKAMGSFGIKRLVDDVSYFQIGKDLQVGDVFLSRKRYELSNLFIPGEWTHAALYIGDNTLVEAVTSGVRMISLPYFCFSKDYIAVMRPLICDDSREKLKSKASELVGLPYDYYFEKSTEAFYCSELVYSLLKVCKGMEGFTVRETLGVQTVVPDDFYKASKFFNKVMEV